MADNVFFSRFLNLRFFMVLCVATALASCGGDDNDSDPTPAPTATPTITPTPTPTAEPDREPDAITFAPVTDATRNTEQTSAVVNITGIDPGTSLSIAGGEYQLGGSGGFVNTETTIDSGTSVQLRTNASANFSETVTVTLTVGTSNFDFVVTTEDQDITPVAFSFTSQTNLDRGTLVTAAEIVTIADVNDTVNVSITGGEYQINDGDFTSEVGSAEVDDQITVRLIAAAEFDTAVTASLTVGTFSADFVATTGVRDLEPDVFSFEAVIEQEPNTENVESNTITLIGINDSFVVSVLNGEYRINNGEFTSEQGVAAVNDQITLRGTASSNTSETVDVVLSLDADSIDPIESTFSITTLDDVTPPAVTIEFPPRFSGTEGDSTFVRGRAEDDYNEISRVTIVVDGVPYEAMDTSGEDEPAFSTWQVEQAIDSPNRPALILGENTVIAQAEDSELNVADNADQVTILRIALFELFPDSNVLWDTLSHIELDVANNRLFSVEEERHLVVDLRDGTRSLVSDNSFEDQNVVFRRNRGLLLDAENERLLSISLNASAAVFSIDIAAGESFGEKSLVFEGENDPLGENNGSFSFRSQSLIFNPVDRNELFISNERYVSRLNLTTLVLDDLSGVSDIRPDIPNTENPFIFAEGIVFDEQQNRLLLADRSLATIFTIDAMTGERGILSRFNGVADEVNDVPNSDGPAFNSPRGIDIDNDRNRLIVSNFDGENILGVDLESGIRREISGNGVPNSLNNFNGQNVADVCIGANLGFFYVMASFNSGATIFAVDHLTGERVIISRATFGD